MVKRVFLIVLDSVGAGEAPDAELFGDKGASTLGHIYQDKNFSCDNMRKLGLGNIDGLEFLKKVENPLGSFAKMTEASMGKDTTTGHWEIAGIISSTAMPTFPKGFPKEILEQFSKEIGKGILCNKPYSGTKVIEDYGKEHLKTGKPIVYTSADSVFQIAAHEDVVETEKLYEYCKIARKILKGKYAVGRVIARPFKGQPGNFIRTADRKDFSLEPTGATMHTFLKNASKDVIGIGKIPDIFAHVDITEEIVVHGNVDCMKATTEKQKEDFDGLCFTNLVDFDMIYGHRNDIPGYARAIAEFDNWLKGFIKKMRSDDVLMITADHGCDPGDVSTDHTREYTPWLIFGDKIKSLNLGVRPTFAEIGKTVLGLFEIENNLPGKDFSKEIFK